MENLSVLFALLFLVGLVLLAVGMVRPTWVRCSSRDRVFQIFGVGTIVCFCLIGVMKSIQLAIAMFAFLGLPSILLVGAIRPAAVVLFGRPTRKQVGLTWGLATLSFIVLTYAISGRIDTPQQTTDARPPVTSSSATSETLPEPESTAEPSPEPTPEVEPTPEPEPAFEKEPQKSELAYDFCYALQVSSVCDNLIMRMDTQPKIREEMGVDFRQIGDPYGDDCRDGISAAVSDEVAEVGDEAVDPVQLCQTAWDLYGCYGSKVPRLIQESPFGNDDPVLCEYSGSPQPRN